MDTLYTTPGGYRRILDRLELARDRYFQICAQNEEAAGAGDTSVWHDNFAYEENQRQMHQQARRVRDLENMVARMQIVPVQAEPGETVRIGARVCLADLEADDELVLFIAGYEDGDPASARISYNSPMAKALLGRAEGDVTTVRVGQRVRQVEIVALLPPPAEEVGP